MSSTRSILLRLLILACALALTVPGCVGTGDKLPPLKPAPAVPPPGTGSGSPISLQLLAPVKPVVIEASQFDTVRAVAEAASRKNQLIAEMRAAGQKADPASLSTPELRALHSVITQGRKLEQGIKLTLRVSNTGPDPVRIRYGPEIGHHDLWVDGPGVIYLQEFFPYPLFPGNTFPNEATSGRIKSTPSIMTHKSNGRRHFLTTAAATSVLALSRSAYSSVLGANERVRFALIGCGGRGGIVTHNMIKMGGELVGLCDLNPTEIRKVASDVSHLQTKKPRAYNRMEQVLEAKDIDAVIIATPDHWHAPAAVMACQAGKDVYVEKPHAHNIWESQQLAQAAAKYGRVVQVGTQNRSCPYNSAALDYVKSGKLGDIRLVKVYNLKSGSPFHLGEAGQLPSDFDWSEWQGPAAERPWHQRIYNGGWHHFWTYSGGDLADDACHQIDLACMLMGDPGFPLSVSSAGGRMAHKGDDSEVPDLLETAFEFPEFIMTLEHSNYPKFMRKTTSTIRRNDELPYWTHNATRIELYGSEMMMTIGRHGGGWVVTRLGGRPADMMYGRPGDQPHCTDFIASVKSRKEPNASLDKLHPSISLLHLANIAHRVGNKKLWWDDAKAQFAGDKDASAMIRRDYRKGFEFPSG